MLINEYPIYLWLLGIFNALIAITYPIGIIGAFVGASEGFAAFIGIVAITYFIPLYLGIFRDV